MIIGDAERRKYEAHLELAARYGTSSVMPLKVETTFFVSHAAEGVTVSVIEIPVRVDAEVSILAEGDVVTRLGQVGWRDYRHSDAFRTATYFLSKGEVPHLLRTPGLGYGEDVSSMAADPFGLVEWLIEQCEREIRGISEPTPEQTRAAVVDHVENRIREGVTASQMVVSRGGDAKMVRTTDVPHFKVTTSDLQGADAAYWDVVVDRPEDFESMNWKELGLRFEPWEAEIAGRVVRAYGVKHDRTVPEGVDFRGYEGDVAVDLAVAGRFATKSLLPQFVKKVMLDLSSSELEQDETVRGYTSAAYAAASKGQWGSPELDEALSGLHDLWKYDQRFSDFSRSKGWDSMLSPFEVMAARAEAFPWRGVAPQAAAPSPAP